MVEQMLGKFTKMNDWTLIAPVLTFPYPVKYVILNIDASFRAIGVVWIYDLGREKVIAFASKNIE